MPPNPPAGWNIPLWLQITVVLVFILWQPIMWALNYFTKERGAQKVSEADVLADNQKGFAETLLNAAKSVPELLDRIDKLILVNGELRSKMEEQRLHYEGEIKNLQRQIDELRKEVEKVEQDRDAWREQAIKVPQLEGQIQTLHTLLREKETELHAVLTERDALQKQVEAFAT